MTHKQRVLALLSDGNWHAHLEGYRLGVMLHSRVSDLRREGHRIECRRNGELYEYRLLERATVGTASPAAVASSSGPLREAGHGAGCSTCEPSGGDAVAPASPSGQLVLVDSGREPSGALTPAPALPGRRSLAASGPGEVA